jgi:hypothetical protein
VACSSTLSDRCRRLPKQSCRRLLHRRSFATCPASFEPLFAPWLQLSGKLDVEAVLTHAEALAEHAGARGRQLLATLDSA